MGDDFHDVFVEKKNNSNNINEQSQKQSKEELAKEISELKKIIST